MIARLVVTDGPHDGIVRGHLPGAVCHRRPGLLAATVPVNRPPDSPTATPDPGHGLVRSRHAERPGRPLVRPTRSSHPLAARRPSPRASPTSDHRDVRPLEPGRLRPSPDSSSPNPSAPWGHCRDDEVPSDQPKGAAGDVVRGCSPVRGRRWDRVAEWGQETGLCLALPGAGERDGGNWLTADSARWPGRSLRPGGWRRACRRRSRCDA